MPRPPYRPTSSVARHHAEWLSLLDISGPFLSVPVLLRAFPQGLEPDDPDLKRDLRAAYEEWLDNQGGTRPNPAIHRAWVEWVLRRALDMADEVLCTDPAALQAFAVPVAEQNETLRPDLAVATPGDPKRARLLVQIVPPRQPMEGPLAGSHWAASPATRMMELLHATSLPLGLVTNGEQWMLVHAPRNQTTGYISWYADLWLQEPLTLQAFGSLLRMQRFFGVPDEETIEALLADSANEQQEITDQLGRQVREALAILVRAIDRADQDRGGALLATVPEARLYEAGVTVMMRLVFLLAAEERGLFLLGDPLYDQHYAVSTLRALLHERADHAGEEVLERHHDAWCRLLATFRAVYAGVRHDQFDLPAYGGGLFDPDRFPFLEGRPEGSDWRTTPSEPLPIDNRTVLHLLDALQMLQVQVPGGGSAEARRLSFRALDIEQIGHVYEGLLDHTARRATEPILGLERARDKVADLPLAALEARLAKGREDLVAFLKDETGRSPGALRKALEAGPDLDAAARLRAACGNDEALLRRVLPLAGLIRDDDYGHPVVVPAGHVYVTAGQERRATGTHYTPRSLTEPIVQHTLVPQVYAGPAEGAPRERWTLRPAGEILALKVCDMAMGSGAFLVQACRYLSERLVEAWEKREGDLARRHPGETILITPLGERTRDGDEALPADAEERLRLARRLVADRCLFGVDKNPLAVEMAKLSLWLVTLEKNRPFTFLDHALKCGDSLVGVGRTQLQYWTLHPDADAAKRPNGFGTELDMREVIRLRREIAALPDRDIYDQRAKADLLSKADGLLDHLREGGNLLVASYYSDAKGRAVQALRDRLWKTFRTRADAPPETPDLATVVPGGVRPLHWEIEFPEVFEAGGFDAIVGNPPFMGGLRISTNLGAAYLGYLRQAWPDAGGTIDLCGFFYRRAFYHLKPGGSFGLIATNTIAQGDTREGGLDRIVASGGSIYRAENDRPWLGTAGVTVDVVHVRKGTWTGEHTLDGEPVRHINAYLDRRRVVGSPHRLAANEGLSFIGSFVLGMGFVLKPEEALVLIERDPRNKEVLFPYLNAEDLNTRPDQSPSRWVINFSDWPLERSAKGRWVGANQEQRRKWLQAGCVPTDYPGTVAADYPDCLTIVREKVRPFRELNRNRQRREIWWRFTRPTVDLYATIVPLRRVLVTPLVSKYVSFVLTDKTYVYAHRLAVFPFEDYAAFAVLQSYIHEVWARAYSSTLETRINYSPSDCFETFPGVQPSASVSHVGETYHGYRCQLMLARQEGLTATYNHFHDPEETSEDIARLRELHCEMDQAVAAAYGWHDLDLGHGFHDTPQGLRYTISPPARDEVLDRLLALNQERYEEEVRQGLHEGKKGRGKGRLV